MKPEESILEAMRLGTDYRAEVVIRSQAFRLRPLANAETIRVADTVNEILMGLPAHKRHKLTEHTLVARETLKIASTPEFGVNSPTITDFILERMTNDELHGLYEQYVQICDRVNPKLERMAEADVRALVEELKKNKEQARLDLLLIELSSLQLVNVCRSLILEESPQAN